MSVRHGSKAFLATGALVALTVAGCGSSSKTSAPPTSATGGAGGSTATTPSANTASAPGITPSTIKIGFVTDVTGVASSTFFDAAGGARAAFDAINAAGGVDGRQIQLVTEDGQSTPAGDLAATQSLLSQNVYAIENFSSFLFGSYKLTQEQGIPITGGGFDGPEWGQQPNTNMFSTTGDTNGRTSNNTISANFFKLVGAPNVGGLAYGISPSSTSSIVDLKTALGMTGGKMGYENLSVPFGGVDVTSYVLAMKQAGVNGAACSCVQSTNLALFTALKQAGLTNVKALSFSSADNSVFTSGATAEAAAQGAYYPSQIPPLDLNNSATNLMIHNLTTYDSSLYHGGYPSFGATGAYLAAELMVKGLQVAGQNPTRQTFINNLRQVSSWDANGLLASPVAFNNFGHSQPSGCGYYVQVQGTAFHSINGGKPICGTSF
jgi:branched-chain amino acid transport system substrate-binding protein